MSTVTVLENVPEDEKDWRSRSDNLVLDLVHPSLFCAAYDRTQYRSGADGTKLLKAPHPTDGDLPEWAYSRNFAWIPTDFQVGHEGAPARALGYINNVHPQRHAGLVSAIEALVGRFSLLWDQVLTDMHPDNKEDLPGRVKTDGWCGWDESDEHPEPEFSGRENLTDEWDELKEAYKENRTFIPPGVSGRYDESGQDVSQREASYSIQGKKVQVIVKLVNIHLVCDTHVAIFLSIQ